MRAFWVFIIIGAATIGWFGFSNPLPATPIVPDVSWPNCGLKLPTAPAGIVGVTGGLALRPNPCLRSEAANYRHLSVYVNTGYPGPKVASWLQQAPKHCLSGDKLCLAYNYGYNSGRYDINYALKQGVLARNWWLDVETENSWDNDPWVNRSALSGTLDALGRVVGRANLGFYAFPGQWDKLTGRWRNGYPAWVATGSVKLQDARGACRAPSFTGGPVIYGQYTPVLDANVACAH